MLLYITNFTALQGSLPGGEGVLHQRQVSVLRARGEWALARETACRIASCVERIG